MTVLHQLAYYSYNRLPGDPCEVERQIQELLDSARRKNSRRGLTGALLFNRGCFAQILEGARDAVECTFESIMQDERHTGVTVLSYGPIEERVFGHWSMAFIGRHAPDQERFGPIAEVSGFDVSRVLREDLSRALLRLLREEEMTGAGPLA